MVVEPVEGGPDALAARAAIWLADRIWAAVAARGCAHVAVSGGSTPAAMFERLGTLPLPWTLLHIWQVDERVAPDGDANRNAGQLTPLARAALHLAPVTETDLRGAAERYGHELRAWCDGVLDVVHLGVGDDGHTASWPPGEKIRTDVDVDVVGPFRGHLRLTLSPLLVNAARELLVLAAGETKAPVLASLMHGGSALPLGLLRRGNLTVLADRPALSGVARTVSLE